MPRLLRSLGLALLLAGCVQPVPPPAPKPPAPPHAATDYFDALADDLPEQSDELVWVVQRLAQHGRLSEADVNDFYAAFPGVKSQNRSLSEQDRTTLRGLR